MLNKKNANYSFQGTGLNDNSDERRLAHSSSGNNYSSMGYTGPYGVTTPTSTQTVQPPQTHAD